MVLICNINLDKPQGESFTAGSNVSGIVKYEIDEETVFKKITVSLCGSGKFKIIDDDDFTYRNSENYVDIDNYVKYKSMTLHKGNYDIPFNFALPRNIPPSLKYARKDMRYNITCNVTYCVSAVFDKAVIVEEKKEITVVSGIEPRLPMEPTILGKHKKLTRIFTRKPSIVRLKATANTCVIAPDGKIQLHLEVANDTNLLLKGVEMKLIETHTFITKNLNKIKRSVDIQGTSSKFGPIAIGATSKIDLLINLPSAVQSLDYSSIVSRDYFVIIKANIPFPHIDAVLEIPIQIGNINKPDADKDPPTYSEVMNEVI